MNKITKFAGIALAFAFAMSVSVAGAATYNFTKDLTVGSTGADVVALQDVLIGAGKLTMPAGVSKGYFGTLTQKALSAWQAEKGITPSVGYFGPKTRAAMAGVDTGSTTGGSTTGSTTLEGGAGSVETYTLNSKLNNEEVGEDEEDVEVYGLDIEADDESDLQIKAVKLVFDEGGAGTTGDFEDYASEVSVLLDGEEYARVDADVFTDDNNWTKTLSLDKGAVIDAGEEATLTVAVSGASNLDSNDVDDTWTLDVTSVRYADAQGTVVSEDPTENARTFSFKTFASAADVELKVSLGDDEINDAHVIDVDDTDDTTDVELLSFNVEVEGDSDIVIDELPINIDVTGAGNVDDMITSVYLLADGEEIGSEDVPATAGADETITFDDLDFTVEAGEEVEFVVTADFLSLADALDAGDTIAVQLSGTEVDLIDAEDESGESLVAGDLTGTAVGDAHGAYASGVKLSFVSADAEVDAGDPTATNDHDLATFTLVFDVEAFDADMYVDKTAPTLAGGTTESDLNLSQGNGTIVSANIDSTGAEEGTNAFLVEEGETERFTITTVVTPTADGLFQLELGNLLYATTDVDGDTTYTFNLDDFKTKAVYLNNDAA